MESVSKAKQRFRQYPVIFAKCSREASVYATCVLKQDNIKKNDCAEEFSGFRTCLRKAAVSLKTKI
ncbi:NADH dehydrogenase [ubiquinone] 1 alpha subcomplex assembly factor 8 [Euwallacea fornicatus]|uniref:NADH dehydrogenase [ubiquinone] 1 alpha subcomplex assembly factor 8 n=1 Tax=Euwallacea fornicatus TaxID=995702 RepID=UPI00338F6699